MGHKQTPGYHKTRVLNKVRLFDRFQSKESELDRFEKLGSCAALLYIPLCVRNVSPPGQTNCLSLLLVSYPPMLKLS